MRHDITPGRARFEASIAEMKADIEQLIEPHARHGKSGVVIIALLELAMERHLRRFPDQGSTRALVEGVLDKVLTRRSTA